MLSSSRLYACEHPRVVRPRTPRLYGGCKGVPIILHLFSLSYSLLLSSFFVLVLDSSVNNWAKGGDLVVESYFPRVPGWWKEKAAIEAKESFSCGACFVGDVIWRQSKLRKRTTGLQLPVLILKQKGFGRRYIKTALNTLESAGLITVEWFDHKSREITLITSEKEAKRLAAIRSEPNGQDKKAAQT